MLDLKQYSYDEDDGGSAKGSGRRNKRQLKRIINVGLFVLGIIGVFYFLILVQHNVSNRIAMKRLRNKIALRKHMDRFKTVDDDFKSPVDKSENVEEHKEEDYDDCTSQRPKYRWIDLRQLPPLDNDPKWFRKYLTEDNSEQKRKDFVINYFGKKLCWESKAEEIGDKPPQVDYTKIKYQYPDPIFEPPRGGSYPEFETMEDMFKKWPQENIDEPPNPYRERLQHFDFRDPEQMKAAVKYRDLEFPFKIYNIPEIDIANKKWTDDYLSFHFDRNSRNFRKKYKLTDDLKEAKKKFGDMGPSSGKAQYSVDSFFAFFRQKNWNIQTMGSPPTM